MGSAGQCAPLRSWCFRCRVPRVLVEETRGGASSLVSVPSTALVVPFRGWFWAMVELRCRSFGNRTEGFERALARSCSWRDDWVRHRWRWLSSRWCCWGLPWWPWCGRPASPVSLVSSCVPRWRRSWSRRRAALRPGVTWWRSRSVAARGGRISTGAGMWRGSACRCGCRRVRGGISRFARPIPTRWAFSAGRVCVVGWGGCCSRLPVSPGVDSR